MKRAPVILLAAIASVAVTAGCEKPVKTPSSPAPPGTAAISLTVTDAVAQGLPAGVALEAFELEITQAELQPGNVSLLSAPVTLEVSQLQTIVGLLGTGTAAAGDYTSLSLTVANPALTVVNDSGASIGGCANGAICRVAPAVSPVTIAFSNAPFPLTVVPNSPIGFQIEIVPAAIIQSDLSLDLSATGGFLLTPIQAAQGQLAELDEVEGTVTGAGAGQFTLKTTQGSTLTIATDASTLFEGFDQIGCANGFSCLAANQPIETSLSLATGGGLTALAVALEDAPGTEQVKGQIVALDSVASELTLVTHAVLASSAPGGTGLALGAAVTVSIEPQATFQTDFTQLNLASYAGSFVGSGNLLAGQEVKVRALSGSTAALVTTDRVTLASGQLTGQVLAVTDPFFALGNLPAIFTATGTTDAQVATQFVTMFENVAGTSSLTPGDTVSVSGPLFPTPGTPTVPAEIVRER
jgi:Domain of unknown function (DUF5666)